MLSPPLDRLGASRLPASMGASRGTLSRRDLVANAPTTCLSNRDMYIATDEATGHKLKLCNSSGNGWDDVGSGGASASVPTGSIVFLVSGTCAAGWAEAPELDGKTIIGTLAANGDVGTTGGADNITPAGTVAQATFTGHARELFPRRPSPVRLAKRPQRLSAGTPAGTNSVPTFTGSALATHAHELPWQIPTTTTISADRCRNVRHGHVARCDGRQRSWHGQHDFRGGRALASCQRRDACWLGERTNLHRKRVGHALAHAHAGGNKFNGELHAR
jgi:hypothetical protein